MTPRQAKCVVCDVARKLSPEREAGMCQNCAASYLSNTGDDINWAARRARAFERKHATKAAHAEAMRNVYQHYKGGTYRRLLPDQVRMGGRPGAANHDNVKMIVYACMKTGIVWVRPLSEWTELVKWPDGVVRTRFVLKRQKKARKA